MTTKNINKSQGPNLPKLPPLDLAHPASITTPPLPPAKLGMLGHSDLFTQESHLGFSGRLGGARGTGSVHRNRLYIPVGEDSRDPFKGMDTEFVKLRS